VVIVLRDHADVLDVLSVLMMLGDHVDVLGLLAEMCLDCLQKCAWTACSDVL
jgi:hypothetical protein